MNDNKPKQKRTISEEQRKKMAEGRKRAMEERKKKQESLSNEEQKLAIQERKIKAQEKKKLKELHRAKELELELQALTQQRDRIEAMKKTKEHRSKFREKIREEDAIKMVINEVVENEPIKNEVVENEVEPIKDDPISNKEEHTNIIDNNEKIFRHTVSSLSHNAHPETKKIFKLITNKYDSSLDISTNLNNMTKELKKMVANNTKYIKKNEAIIKKEQEKVEIKELTPLEIKEEKKYKSQLNSLMNKR